MDIKEKAEKLHKSGFNCAQSVLGACGEYTGLDDNTALAVSAGFGGGVRSGEICGAISGAVMAIGMAQQSDPAEPEERWKIPGKIPAVSQVLLPGTAKVIQAYHDGMSAKK